MPNITTSTHNDHGEGFSGRQVWLGTALVGFALGLLETGSYPVGIGLTLCARQVEVNRFGVHQPIAQAPDRQEARELGRRERFIPRSV
jgi:hypothetical protein